MATYSQFYEDIILLWAFDDVEKGFYIDIGANDPDEMSVTKAFYLKGWNGINIEPQLDKYNSLLEKRQKDINLQIGVGKITGNATLYLNGGCSTIHKELLKKKKFINLFTLKLIQ